MSIVNLHAVPNFTSLPKCFYYIQVASTAHSVQIFLHES